MSAKLIVKYSCPIIIGALSASALIGFSLPYKHQITNLLSSQNRKVLDFEGDKDDQKGDELLNHYSYDYLNFVKVGNKKIGREELKKKCKALLNEEYSKSNYEKFSRGCSGYGKVSEVLKGMGINERTEEEWNDFKSNYGNSPEIQELANYLKSNCAKYGSRETISYLYETSINLYANYCISDSNRSKIPLEIVDKSRIRSIDRLFESKLNQNLKIEEALILEKYELATSSEDGKKLLQNATYDYMSFAKVSGKTISETELEEKCRNLFLNRSTRKLLFDVPNSILCRKEYLDLKGNGGMKKIGINLA